MIPSPTDLKEIVQLAPEWETAIRSAVGQGKLKLHDVLGEIGARAIFLKLASLDEERGRLLVILRNNYYQPLLMKMLTANVSLRRFWSQRRMDPDEQRQHAMSFSVDLAHKMEGVLIKQLNTSAEDGYKVLLPAYVQRAVHNAIVDYIRQEWSWEKHTLQDLSLDPDQDDPRQAVAEDPVYAPEQQAISREQTGQLNQLRQHLEQMLADQSFPREPLVVIDCLFGLGLTEHSKLREEMTMREVCDRLGIAGETQARRIARCQVLMDKGMDLIRQQIRERLPGIVESWQGTVNVNSASRRELSQQLGMTEGEVDRLIGGRQYHGIKELVERGVIKANRLNEITEKGGVAAFVPVDLNSATVRDMIDILALNKDIAQRIASERPFPEIKHIVVKKIIDEGLLQDLVSRGAVLRVKTADSRRLDLNSADLGEVVATGVPENVGERILRGRPFVTWSELEEFLGCEGQVWAVIRQKFCLGLSPG